MKNIMKKILIIMLAFTLLYANGVITINSITNSIISYATENLENQIDNSLNSDEQSEIQDITKIEMQRNEICKTDMKEVAYQYTENLKLNLSNANSEEIIISDISNTFYKGETEVQEEITNNYKTTRINRDELMQVLGETGNIQIKDKDSGNVILDIEKTDLDAIKIAQEGEIIDTIKIQNEGEEEITIANIKAYEEHLEIEYIAQVEKIETIITYTEIIESQEEQILNIRNTKEIGIIENTLLAEITKLNTKIDYEEIESIGDIEPKVRTNVDQDTTIKERASKVEIDINKQELSTVLENNIQFTITLFTENYMYDLYKNPTFKIELPECVETINTINKDDIIILNNKIANELEEQNIFTDFQITQQKENNKNYIEISLQGEQTTYNEASINNVQIVIPAKIKTSNLLPTTNTQINLYYTNQNKTTYLKESTIFADCGEHNEEVSFIATIGIISKTVATVENNTVEQYKDEEKSLIVKSKQNNTGKIEITAVNNTNRNLTSVKILGKSQLMGEIILQNAVIYYSTEANATLESSTWSSTYIEGAKSYLIEIENLNQGEKIEYNYNIKIPKVEEDTRYEETYKIFAGEEELIEQKIGIEVKTVKLDISLEASVGANTVYTGQELTYIIKVQNIGETKATGISIESTLPQEVSLVDDIAETTWENLELEPNEVITKHIKVKVNDLQTEQNIVSTIEVNADYLEEAILKNVQNLAKISKVDASLLTRIERKEQEQENLEKGANVYYNISLTNKLDTDQTITVTFDIPEFLDNEVIKAILYKEEEGWLNPDETANIRAANGKIILELTLQALETRLYRVEGKVNKYVEKDVSTQVIVSYDEENIILQDLRQALTFPELNVIYDVFKQGVSVKNSEINLQQGDILTYIITITNLGESAEVLTLNNNINAQLILTNWKYTKENGEILLNLMPNNNSFIVSGEEIEGKETIQLEIVAEVVESITQTTTIDNLLEITGHYIEEEIVNMQNIVNVESEIPENPVGPGNPNIPVQETYELSGIAWLDENENGKRETEEERLTGITVKLLNHNNNILKQSTTNQSGVYNFTGLLQGEYIVVFEYNKNEYKLTTPNQLGVEETLNSDAIETTTNNITIVRTDKINITKNTKNIDIGLISRGIFDLEIRKQISRITIENNEGTKVIDYNNTNFAKVEIPAKYYLGSNLIIEYNITIENKGTIPGYVYSIKDILPEGTQFVAELNSDWYEEEGNLYSVSLTADEIKEGEAETIKLILTKQIETDNAETIINKVQINESFNEELLEEKELKNNESEAEVLITVKTGQERTYIIIAIIVLTIITVGIYTIKKKVLE